MKYRVLFFRNGKMLTRNEINAKSHKQAAQKLINKLYENFSHVTVVGKTTRRYDYRLRPIKGQMRAFRTQHGAFFCVLLMIGNVSELRRFKSIEDREKVYLCLGSTPVACAESAQEQTDIIVSSEETNDSKSGSTSKKISNGSVTNVTWQDTLTRYSIEESFGESSAEDSGKSIWSFGSAPSPSRPDTSTLLATVLRGKFSEEELGYNSTMQGMKGQTIKVKQHGKERNWVVGEGWTWKKEWLDFDNAWVMVQPTEGRYVISSIANLVGKKIHVSPCGDHYTTDDGVCIQTNWLVPAKHQIRATVKTVIEDKMADGLPFVSYMRRFLGKTLSFQKLGKGYLAKGCFFSKEWLIFEEER